MVAWANVWCIAQTYTKKLILDGDVPLVFPSKLYLCIDPWSIYRPHLIGDSFVYGVCLLRRRVHLRRKGPGGYG
jgi:hypothetical protein